MKTFLEKLQAAIGAGFLVKAEQEALAKEYTELENDEARKSVDVDYNKVKELPETIESKEVAEVKDYIAKEIAGGVSKAVEAIEKGFTENLEKSVNAIIEKTKKDGMLLNDNGKARRDYLSKTLNEYMCSIGDDAKMKDLSTDATGTPFGGYVVDSELNAEINALITEYGVARREFSTIQLSKNSYKTNELVTDVVVYWPDEGAAISSSQTVLGQNELELKKLATIVSMTNELIDDQEIDLFGFIGQRVAQAFAREEDEAFFDGDGTATHGSFTGLLRSANVNTVTMAGTTFISMDADDLIDMQDETPQGALANAKYYMHRSIMTIVRKLKDDNGVYIYQPISAAGPATIWGYPVVLVEAMPAIGATAADTTFVIFADLKKGVLFGFKGAITVNRFDAGTVLATGGGDLNLITTDRQAVRWTERVGFMQLITTLDIPVTVLATAAASV